MSRSQAVRRGRELARVYPAGQQQAAEQDGLLGVVGDRAGRHAGGDRVPGRRGLEAGEQRAPALGDLPPGQQLRRHAERVADRQAVERAPGPVPLLHEGAEGGKYTGRHSPDAWLARLAVCCRANGLARSTELARLLGPSLCRQRREHRVTTAAQQRPLGLETNGINVIGEDERKGSPRSLFWPWFAANISVLGLSYGAYVLGFGISFWQACVGRADRDRRELPARRVHRGGREARVRADAGAVPRGVRRAGQQAARPGVLDPQRRLGDRAHRAGDAGHRDGVPPARLEFRRRHQGDRLPRHHRADRRQRGPRLRHDHAAADRHHRGDRDLDRRLLHPRRGQDPLGTRSRRCTRAPPRRSSARPCWWPPGSASAG